MKPSRQIIIVGLLLIGAMFVIRLFAAETKNGSAYEYATIRWDGKDNTHIVRPGVRLKLLGLSYEKCQSLAGRTTVHFT